jgi:hypothetical protein
MAVVWEKTAGAALTLSEVVPYLSSHWTWAGGVVDDTTTYQSKIFYIDAAKTIGLYLYIRTGTNDVNVGVRFKGTNYHLTQFDNATLTYKVEITDTALILSYVNSASISASDCEKIIICSGYNAEIDTNEQILIYLGSKSSSNVSSLYASDVTIPANISEQNANANVNAKTTNLIPFYSTASEFITTDVLKSLCEDIGAWYFGNVMVNNKAYRMSGSVFALDE